MLKFLVSISERKGVVQVAQMAHGKWNATQRRDEAQTMMPKMVGVLPSRSLWPKMVGVLQVTKPKPLPLEKEKAKTSMQVRVDMTAPDFLEDATKAKIPSYEKLMRRGSSPHTGTRLRFHDI